MNDLKENMKAFGSLGYSFERIALILELIGKEKDDFIKNCEKESSMEYQYYKIGEAQGIYEIDKKLHEMAINGDVKAMQEIRIRKIKND